MERIWLGMEDKTTGGDWCEASCISVLVGNTWRQGMAIDHVPCYGSGSDSRQGIGVKEGKGMSL